MSDVPWTVALFEAIDAMDPDRFVSYLAEDGVFRFGNGPAVRGRAAVRDAVAGFFGGIRGLSHAIEETWVHPDAVIVKGMVTYTRLDESTVALPFVDLLRTRDGLIVEYLIYMDVNPLFAGGS